MTLASLLLSRLLSAQTVTGTLQGTVRDTQAGVLPGATIAIHNAETGQERAITTNERGFYSHHDPGQKGFQPTQVSLVEEFGI